MGEALWESRAIGVVVGLYCFSARPVMKILAPPPTLSV